MSPHRVRLLAPCSPLTPDEADYLRENGWSEWRYANPALVPHDAGVWSDPTSLDDSRKLAPLAALAEQRARDTPTLFPKGTT